MKDNRLMLTKMYKEKLERSFLLFAIIPTVLASLLFFLLLYYIGQYVSSQELLKRNQELSTFLESEVSSYKEQIQTLQGDPALIQILQDNGPFYREMYEKLYGIVTGHQLKSTFYVVNTKGDMILTNAYKNSPVDMHDVNTLSEASLPNKEAPVLQKEKKRTTDEFFLRWSAPLYQEEKLCGFLIFDLNSAYLKRFFEESTYTDFVITDSFGNELYTSKTSLILDNGKLRELNKKDYSVVKSEIAEGELNVHAIRYIGFLRLVFYFGIIGVVILSSLLIMITKLFANHTAKKKTKSIDTILSTIADVKQGTYKGYKELEEHDELEYINFYLNEMIQYRDLLLMENKEILIRKTEAEIKELQMQFNPHFLFNTLENIKFMIRIDPPAAEKLLLTLSSILRYSIDNTGQESPLKEDMKYIQDYLEIQKSRFEERLNYSIDLPEELGVCRIPKLITQPLVENAIKYGMDDEGGLNVILKVGRTKKSLLIMIADTGPGFRMNRLRDIRSLLQHDDNLSSHIGIYNVHRRIQLKYGHTFGVRVFSTVGKGSLLAIKLPIREEERL